MRTCAVVLLCLLPVAAVRGQSTRVAVVDVNVVDVEGTAVRRNQTVLVEDGRIRAVGGLGDIALGENVQRVDGAGRYLVPGFWDMHGHLTGESSDTATILPLYLIHGVTGVREMWSDPPGVVVDSGRGTTMLQQLQLLRADIESGRMMGPRLVLTSAPLDGPFGPDDYVHVIRDASDASRVVGESATRGVDAINVFSGLTPEAYAAAGRAARDRGLALIGLPPRRVHVRRDGRRGASRSGRALGMATRVLQSGRLASAGIEGGGGTRRTRPRSARAHPHDDPGGRWTPT
jgi:hypothetical protein